MADKRASVKENCFFVDIVGGPMKCSSFGGNNYVAICVDDNARFNVVNVVKKKSDMTAALLPLMENYITSQELSIKCIPTNNGGKFQIISARTGPAQHHARIYPARHATEKGGS